MPLGSGTISTAIAAIVTKPAGGSTTQGRTNTDLSISFANGTGANQAQTVVDVNLTSNNGAIALSTLSDTVGTAFGSLNELKAMVVINSSANGTTFFCNATGAANNVTIDPGGSLVHIAPSANGIAVANTTTIRSNGTSSDSLRVVLFLS